MCNRNSKRASCQRQRRRVAGASQSIAAIAAIVCVIAGCAMPETKTLSLAPTAPAHAATSNPRTATTNAATAATPAGARVLSVEVLPVTEQNAGNVFGSRVVVSGLDERLVDALNATVAKDARIEAKLCAAGAAATIAPGVVRVSFAKAYIHGIYETKSAVVVLRLEHAGGTSHFRAQRTGLNWTGGEEEFRNALIRAFDEAVAKLRPELLKLATLQRVAICDEGATVFTTKQLPHKAPGCDEGATPGK